MLFTVLPNCLAPLIVTGGAQRRGAMLSKLRPSAFSASAPASTPEGARCSPTAANSCSRSLDRHLPRPRHPDHGGEHQSVRRWPARRSRPQVETQLKASASTAGDFSRHVRMDRTSHRCSSHRLPDHHAGLECVVPAAPKTRNDKAKREDHRLSDALRAEIRSYRARFEHMDFNAYRDQVVTLIKADPAYIPFVPLEAPQRIFIEIAKEVHILPPK